MKYGKQLPLEWPVYLDYAGRKVLVPVSAGINSAAALCWLAQAPAALKPAEVHLFYAHLEEHSPDSLEFSRACAAYARQHFAKVFYTETAVSVLALFEKKHMIPHPTIAPCTAILKLEPMYAYMALHGITDNVVGYVDTERRRIDNMAKRGEKTANGVLTSGGVESQFPIAHFSNEWCFVIVDREIGWHPALYDHRWDDAGFLAFLRENMSRLDEDARRVVTKKMGTNERVFGHNNCLPCKNQLLWQLLAVEYFYPAYMARAHALSLKLDKHWGRDADTYYTQFGRAEYEVPDGQPCAHCARD